MHPEEFEISKWCFGDCDDGGIHIDVSLTNKKTDEQHEITIFYVCGTYEEQAYSWIATSPGDFLAEAVEQLSEEMEEEEVTR